MNALLLTSHLVATSAMVGIIWFVQVVQYPLFATLSGEELRKVHAFHCRKISVVVLPLMVLELVTALLLAFLFPSVLSLGAALLLIIIWISTFFVQVPLHSAIERGEEGSAARRLVRSNWIRTVAWSVRVVIVVSMVG